MRIPMLVAGLTIDPVNNAPIVLLREKSGGRIVPIWIGAVEASAIACELESIKPPRPMTHDLLRGTIEALGGKVERVVVVDLREGTYYAVIVLTRDGASTEIDARPSDAVALALRCNAPVFCEEKVIELAQLTPEEREAAAREKQREGPEEDRSDGPKPIVDMGTQSPEEILENLDPEDFGKYKM